MAMKFWQTQPPLKTTDEEELGHEYRLVLGIPFFEQAHDILFADLSEYYRWADANNVKMEHNLCLLRGPNKKTLVMFVFSKEEELVAFKLRWV